MSSLLIHSKWKIMKIWQIDGKSGKIILIVILLLSTNICNKVLHNNMQYLRQYVKSQYIYLNLLKEKIHCPDHTIYMLYLYLIIKTSEMYERFAFKRLTKKWAKFLMSVNYVSKAIKYVFFWDNAKWVWRFSNDQTRHLLIMSISQTVMSPLECR